MRTLTTGTNNPARRRYRASDGNAGREPGHALPYLRTSRAPARPRTGGPIRDEETVMKTLSLMTAAAAVALAAAPAAADVRVERVAFESGGERIVGDLYLPDGYRAGTRLPALVVTGAWMTVRQQMPARYAREMADRGFAALTFDFRGWGESAGARRQLEDPAAKVADIQAAVRYLATRPEADPDRIGGLGICASSGYMVTAAAANPTVRSVALVAPWLQDAQVVAETYGGAEGVAKLRAAGEAADRAFRDTGRQTLVPAASLTDERAVMFKVPYYTEADRGMIAAWRNEADPAFWGGWLSFDAIQVAPRLTKPFMMVHSEAAAIEGDRVADEPATANRSGGWLPVRALDACPAKPQPAAAPRAP